MLETKKISEADSQSSNNLIEPNKITENVNDDEKIDEDAAIEQFHKTWTEALEEFFMLEKFIWKLDPP